MEHVGWGIIGCGAVTEVKSGPAFQTVEQSRLVAVMRRTASLAADYARRHGVPTFYDDARKLVEDPRVDAVYVATPPGSHLEYALLACAAGKPVYVEKPMARNHAECLQMVEAFGEAGVPLFVAYYRRALARFLKARDLVASGRLGTITSVACRLFAPHHRHLEPGALPWRFQPEHSGGGLLLDLGCHTLDILDFLLGPLSDVRGAAHNATSSCAVEDTAALVFRTPSGALGTAHFDFASAARRDEIIVTGDAAELKMSTFGDDPLELREGSTSEQFLLPNPVHIQQPMIASVVAALRGRGVCESTGVSAARTSAVIDRVLEGYYGTRANGFWREPGSWPGCPRPR